MLPGSSVGSTDSERNHSIVIAGASGYVGNALIPRLLQRFPNAKITAFSRRVQKSNSPRLEWKACDLFSFESLNEALPDRVDLAYYLVHSMGPTAHLDQGHFADYDLLLADNFVRALKKREPAQLIYLGGLIPQVAHMSPHLQSRLEVEEALGQGPWATTVLRCGLILGEAGSSFQILLKLVKRLPLMVCPAWTNTRTTPVDINSVISALASVALDRAHDNKIYDLASCRPITYMEMMKETSKKLGKRKVFISVPYFSPKLSRLWVSLVTNTPKALVYPLIESLKHEMVARPEHSFPTIKADRSYSDLMGDNKPLTRAARRLLKFQTKRTTVRSVQRIPLTQGQTAEWARREYLDWLPHFLSPLIKVFQSPEAIRLCLFSKRIVLLELWPDQNHSDRHIQQMQIAKGLLVATGNNGILEFRTALKGRFLLVAIHNYRPALPWYFYTFSQAWMHLMVMSFFRRHVMNIETTNS